MGWGDFKGRKSEQVAKGAESEMQVHVGMRAGGGGGARGFGGVCDLLNLFQSATPSPTKKFPRSFTNDRRMAVSL